MTPKIYDSEPPSVQGRSRFIILWSMYTNICHDVCDPKYLVQIERVKCLVSGDAVCI
jgi:hypothetical protein